ncbi:LysR substrate-binding domain-containing protein [Modicisalibacter radicis]
MPASANARQTILQTTSRPSAWTPWRSRFRQTASIDRELEFEHFYLSLQAARAGLGFAMGSIYMVADQIETGELVAPWASSPTVRPIGYCRPRLSTPMLVNAHSLAG